MSAINLKELLLISLSAKRPVRGQKMIKCGKIRYAVHYELNGVQMIIRQVKRHRHADHATLENRLRKRMRFVRHSGTSISIGKQCDAMVDTRDLNTRTQCSDKQLDTEDLILQVTRSQQTPRIHKSFMPRATQTISKRQESVGVQINIVGGGASVGVQATADKASGDHEISKQEHLLYSIITTLCGQSELMRSGVEGINRLLDFSSLLTLESRMRLQSPTPAPTAASAPAPQPPLVPPTPSEVIASPPLAVALKQQPSIRLRRRIRSLTVLWRSPVKCKHCGLRLSRRLLHYHNHHHHHHQQKQQQQHQHQHSNSHGYVSEQSSQCTQTEIESTRPANIGTQTDKERGFWTLRRNYKSTTYPRS